MPQYYSHFASKQPLQMTWQQVLDEVRSTSNTLYQNTMRSRQLRSEGYEQEANELKRKSGCILPAGCCQGGRDAKNLVALTLFGMVDIDHIPTEQMDEALRRVKADAHTYFCAVTNSQQGIRIIFRYQVVNAADGELWPEAYFQRQPDEEQPAYLARVTPYYRAAWEAGTRYFAQLTGHPSDKSCKDIVRLSFLSHDPDALLNRDAEPLTLTEADVAPYRQNPRRTSPTDSAHAAPVRVRKMIEEKALQAFQFRIDEGLITRLLDKLGYAPSGRHRFWLQLGARLRYFHHSLYEVDAYKTATLRLLNERQLVLSDDPSLRLPHEVEDAMTYGYNHGNEADEQWIEEYMKRWQQPHPLTTSQPHNLTTSQPQPLTTSQPQDLTTSKPQPLTTSQPQDLTTSQPQPLTTSQPQDLTTSQPQPLTTSQPQDLTTSQPQDTDDEDIIEQQCPHFPQSVYMNLPEELWQGLLPVVQAVKQSGVPRRRQDALLMSLLTNYSALCAETQLAYGTHHYSPNLAFMCLSVAGNGKSEMSYGFRIVEQVDNYLEEQSRQARREWQAEMDAYQLSMQDKKLSTEQKKALERPDEAPQDRLLVMPGTTSRSQFTLCMNAMGRDGLIINSTEIQTIASTLKLDVGDFSDLLCKAMANERIDQYFKCDDRRIKIERPKLSVCLSGTFDQFHNFIPDYENGLFSRFGYLMMEPYLSWIDQRPDSKHPSYEQHYKKLAQDAFEMWQMLEQCPTEVCFTPEQWQQHSQMWGSSLDELVREGGQDRISVVNRHGLLHCRIAAVLTVLRKWNEYKRVVEKLTLRNKDRQQIMTQKFASEHQQMLCRDDDYQTALQISQVLLNHALHLSTTIRRMPSKGVQSMQEWPWALQCVMAQADAFTHTDFLNLADKRYHRSRSQAYRSLYAMVRQGYLTRAEKGFYRRTEKLEKMRTVR